ncbi:MAG: glycosyltransferase family 4 protein, partial [Candidatus Saccharimonadales bacterium]
MKILMLGWELPPYNSGGLGVACYQMCKALCKKDVDIEFVLPFAAVSQPDFMKITPAYPETVAEVMATLSGAYDSYKYIYTDGREEWLDTFGQQQLYEMAVERLASSRQFDIIHAHDWLTFRAALKAKQKSGRPLIVHVHSVEADRSGRAGGGNPLVREIEALGMLMADQIVAVSQHTKDAIVREYAIPPGKIKIVHNGLD